MFYDGGRIKASSEHRQATAALTSTLIVTVSARQVGAGVGVGARAGVGHNCR